MRIQKLSPIFLPFVLAFGAGLASSAQIQTEARTTVPFVPSRVTQRVDDERRITLRGNTHPMARQALDQGLVEASLPMERVMLVLKRSPEQEAALAAFDERLYDPKSADFHHWLTADEFGRAYGPSEADIATVTGWLERHGFQIYDVSKGRLFVQFSGTAAQVQEAFHVEMHHYLVKGQTHIANDRDPEIPEALSPVVTGIASLHNFFPVHQSRLGRYVTRDAKTGLVTPVGNPATGVKSQFVFTDPSSGIKSEDIVPYDFATIYNLLPLWNAGYTGKNLSVAISSQTDLNLADITTFRKSFGLSGFAGTVSQVINGADPGIVAGDQVENTLDTEWSGATAPDAKIIVVSSKGTATTDAGTLSTEYIIDNNIAPIMSASYGECEAGLGSAGNSAANSLYQQGSTEGISLFESSGDQGSTGCDNSDATTFPAPAVHGLQVNGLASSPYITAVGGTDFAWQNVSYSTYWNATNASGTQANAIGYINEIPWNGTCTSPYLLTTFFSGENTSEQLCNDAAPSSSGYDHLVDVGGGSGGVSGCLSNTGTFTSCTGAYAKPSWQKGTGVPADGVRDVPDVSLFASGGYPDGIPGSAYLICVSSSSPDSSCDYSGDNIVYQEVGGTSVSSPAMAGITALILQKVGGKNLGLINPVLYQLAATENLANCNASTVGKTSSCIFYDVTAGNNAMVCTTGSLNCVTNTNGDGYGIVSGYSSTTGYDLVTGLGSVNAYNLANAWPASSGTTTISISPTTLAFGSQNVGTTSAAKTVTLTNTGTTAISFSAASAVSGTNAGSFIKTAGTCPNPLPAGQSCTNSVDFDPTVAGALTATLTIYDNATGSPHTVALTGTGASAGPTITVTPSLTFASTAIGTTTAAQNVTITNTGSSAITFSTASAIGGTNASSFIKSGSTCPDPLPAGQSCTNSIEFDPTASGALSGTLTIYDNAAGGPHVVTLNGTGAGGGLSVSVSPSSLSFAATAVGATSAAQTVTIKNTGSSALTLNGNTFTGTNPGSFLKSATTCVSPLAAGASCTNSIEFMPTVAGTLTASLNVNTNAPGSPTLVSLTGVGGSSGTSTVTLGPASLAFPNTVVGSTSSLMIATLTNTGTASVTVSSIAISGTNATSFVDLSGCGSALAASASCSIYVGFTPTAAGALTATLNVTDSASGSPQKVTLTGTGSAAPALKLSATALSFPTTKVGTMSPIQSLTLTNTGGATVVLTSIAIGGVNPRSFLALNNCGATLAAGAVCTVYIGETPTVTGSLSATLTIVSTGSGSPQTVTLSGAGD